MNTDVAKADSDKSGLSTGEKTAVGAAAGAVVGAVTGAGVLEGAVVGAGGGLAWGLLDKRGARCRTTRRCGSRWRRSWTCNDTVTLNEVKGAILEHGPLHFVQGDRAAYCWLAASSSTTTGLTGGMIGSSG